MGYEENIRSKSDFATQDPLTKNIYLINRYELELTMAEVRKEWWATWVLFRRLIDRTFGVMDADARKRYEEDYRLFLRYENDIMTTPSDKMNEVTKEKKLEQLRRSFIDAHRYYMNVGISRSGVIMAKEEGIVDMTKHEFDEMAAICSRRTSAIETVIADKREAREAKANAASKGKGTETDGITTTDKSDGGAEIDADANAPINPPPSP